MPAPLFLAMVSYLHHSHAMEYIRGENAIFGAIKEKFSKQSQHKCTKKRHYIWCPIFTVLEYQYGANLMHILVV